MSTMPIHLSQLLPIQDPTQFKLHVARHNGRDHPLDIFVENKTHWRGWNSWRNPKNEFNRDYIFSLIDFYPENDRWLFGGIFKVLERKDHQGADGYIIEELSEYANLVGRLKIHLPKPSRGRAFLLEKHYERMTVDEILREPYSGALFPGFENIVISFHELKAIVASEKPDWKAALMGVKGVYCIMDRSSGNKYIGSAYGDSGIWSRWSQYVWSGHGGNVRLRELVEDKGIDYVMENFQIALLEHRSFKTDDSVIIQREQHWKRLMLSRGDFGYNGN